MLNLASSVELILKERLRRRSWKLVFANPDQADEQAHKRGSFQSVGLKTAIKRLESECSVRFEKLQLRRLFTLRDKRNRIQHFNIVDSTEAVMATTADALEVMVEFIGKELNQNLTDEEKGLLKGLRTKLSELENFVSVREKLRT